MAIPLLLAVGKTALVTLAKNPDAVGKVLGKMGSMPNWELGTLGGRVFWDDLVEHEGWRLQRNKVFGNCRILDPNDVRVAWGGEAAMIEIMQSLSTP